MNDRNYLISSLCYQILGMRETQRDGSEIPRAPTAGAEGVGDVRLSLEVQGIVRNQTRQFYIDSAAWTEKIVEEIRRQAANLDLNALVAEKVRAEIARVKSDLDRIVQSEVQKVTALAIQERLRTLPDWLAGELASRLYHEAYQETSRKAEAEFEKTVGRKKQ